MNVTDDGVLFLRSLACIRRNEGYTGMWCEDTSSSSPPRSTENGAEFGVKLPQPVEVVAELSVDSLQHLPLLLLSV